MKAWTDSRGDASALVVDGNVLSRQVATNQLRDLGFKNVSGAARVVEARRQLEFKVFDLVLCEQNFPQDSSTGQDLLDDLRRCGLLPFSTIFIMLTAEASYSRVAEAAESALDAYLLRPYNTVQLEERIVQARHRKMSLREIFMALDQKEFAQAARLCLQRFAARGEYWLYATRVGAEIFLRLGQCADAQRLYEAVVEAKAVPWARLGVARAQIDQNQAKEAMTILEGLIDQHPGYADAYDVMGRAQIDLGHFDEAMAACKMATDITPESIQRLQRYGMLAHYCGHAAIADDMLSRSVKLGLDSKMFDAQSLVLLAFMRLKAQDRAGLQRCHDDMQTFLERNPDSRRLWRLSRVTQSLLLLHDHQTARLLEEVRAMMVEAREDHFDFEAACNTLTMASLLAAQAIQLGEVDDFVKTTAMRFCTSKAMAELLSRSCEAHAPFQSQIVQCQSELLRMQEQAVKLGMAGNGDAAVLSLLRLGESTLNSKVIETAWGVFKRYHESMADAQAVEAPLVALREKHKTHQNRAALGDAAQRSAGGVSLRMMDMS